MNDTEGDLSTTELDAIAKLQNSVAGQKKILEQYSPEIQTELKRVMNGLESAIFGGVPGVGFPFGAGAQLSQVDTLFKNNRWYLLSNMRQLLSQLYVEHGLVSTIVNVPVDDALRGGVDFKSDQLSPEQVLELQLSMDRDNDLTTAGFAAKWTRLFGGGAVIIMTGQDPATPLDVEAIKEDSPLEFRDADLWELFYDYRDDSGNVMVPEDFQAEYYSYYGIKLHHTRVLRFNGLRAPSYIRPRLRGWGLSVVEQVVRSINQYLKSTDLSFEVLDEFKLDVFRLKNLYTSILDPDGEAKIHKRVQLANRQKNFQNALVLDVEDEYQQKQLSFTGLAEVQLGIRLQCASDLRMPLSKVFGIGAQGFSSGEDDIENYNGMVESTIRQGLKRDLLRMAELKCQQKFGFIPDDLSLSFKPLRVLSSEQEENVKTQKFNRLHTALQSGAITLEFFQNACNAADLFPVKLDPSDLREAEQALEEEAAAEDEETAADGGESKKSKLQAKKAKEAKT